MMTREELESYLYNSLVYNHDAIDCIWAIVDNDNTKLAEIRSRRSAKNAIAKSYLDAYDAAKDDHERNAVICCVRLNEPLRPQEYADKVSSLKSGSLTMGG